jgi:hypothetical protein
MSSQIVFVEPLDGTRVRLRFDDGVEGVLDIAEVIPFDGVVAALRDPHVFRQVSVDKDWGTLCWPGDLDLAPEPLHERLAGGGGGASVANHP